MNEDTCMLNKAIILATTKHAMQKDKGGQPYILHPLRVMLNSSLATNEERIVAVLHDVIEDTDCSVAVLGEQGFTPDIIAAIAAITHLENESQLDYLSRVKANPLAMTVKLADITDNLTPARLDQLSALDRQRLTQKYKIALDYLRGQV